jgi:hypothetical protein
MNFPMFPIFKCETPSLFPCFQATAQLAQLCASTRARSVALLVAIDADAEVDGLDSFDRVLWLRQGKLLRQDEVRIFGDLSTKY